MNSQNFSHKPNKILITGSSGTGKTTFLLRYLQGSQDQEIDCGIFYDKIFGLDAEGELAQRLGVEPTMDSRLLAEQVEDENKKLILYDPVDEFPGDPFTAFRFFCEWCFEVAKALPGKLKLFACDELQVFLTPNNIPWEFSQVIHRGRRAGLDLALASQQLNLIHNTVRNAITETVTFRQEDMTAIKMLAEKGFDPDSIMALPDLHYLIKSTRISGVRAGSILPLDFNGESPKVSESIETSEPRPADDSEVSSEA